MFVLLLWNVFLKSVQWRSETSDTPSVSEDKNIWWIKSKSTVVETSCVFSEFVSLSGCDDKWWLIDGPSGEEWSVLWSDSKKVTSLIPSSYCRSLFFFFKFTGDSGFILDLWKIPFLTTWRSTVWSPSVFHSLSSLLSLLVWFFHQTPVSTVQTMEWHHTACCVVINCTVHMPVCAC